MTSLETDHRPVDDSLAEIETAVMTTAGPASAEGIDDDAAFYRIYGPWEPLTPLQLKELMQGFEPPWWLVGGHAIEAFTGIARPHEDIDISIFVEDVPAFRAQLEGRYHLWSNAGGTFRFFDERNPGPIEPLSQIWVRKHAQAPWIVDCTLSPSVDGQWQSKRDEGHVADLDGVTWIDEHGIRCLNPEIVLLFKDAQGRPKDKVDFQNAWPLLSAEKQAWLTAAIARYRSSSAMQRP
jgi:hypothetical protein